MPQYPQLDKLNDKQLSDYVRYYDEALMNGNDKEKSYEIANKRFNYKYVYNYFRNHWLMSSSYISKRLNEIKGDKK